MKSIIILPLAGLGCLFSCHSGPPRSVRDLHAEALRIHRSAPVFDGHNDLLGEVRDRAHSSFDGYDLSQHLDFNHTDIPRLRTGGVGAQFWSAFVPVSEIAKGTSARYCNEQIDLILAMCARYPADFELALTAADVERIQKSGKIASLIGIEGGHAIENSLEKLDAFYARGARYMTLTHNDTTDWADSATDEPRHGGLASFGEQFVREMNRLGMIVDISHVSADTMRDVLRVSTAPVIASHSSAYALAPHPRNVPDDVLREIARNGGVVMVNFSPNFLDADAARIALGIYPVVREIARKTTDEAERTRLVDEWRAAHRPPSVSFTRVVDHIEYIARVAGVDHVGLGSDFDGIPAVPVDLEDVSRFPVITEELLRRGWIERDIRKVLGENVLRVLRECERVAARQAEAVKAAAKSFDASCRLRMERSTCYGECPSYTVEIDSDGTVTFEGREHVGSKGIHVWVLDKSVVRELFDRFWRAGFFELTHDCSYTVVDNQKVFMEMWCGDRYHQILDDWTHDPLAEDAAIHRLLDALASDIDATAGTARWIGHPWW